MRLTLTRAFAAGGLLLALLLGALVYTLAEGSRQSVLSAASQLRDAAARRVEGLVQGELDGATRAVLDVEREARMGLLDLEDQKAVEAGLWRTLLRSPHFAEVTFTHAVREGFTDDGEPRLAPAGRWQVSVFRVGDASLSRFGWERIFQQDGRFVADHRGYQFDPSSDPTDHLTFSTTASRRIGGKAIWSDLSYAQRDRRVIVSVQKAVLDAAGKFLGVVRAGLLTETIDQIARLRVAEGLGDDPHRVFLADAEGRLITRLKPEEKLESVQGSLRVAASELPEALRLALTHAAEPASSFEVKGRRWLATFRKLKDSQDWLVGVVVPESAYTADLERLRARLIAMALGAVALALASGAAVLVALRRGLGRIEAQAARMRALDFAPTPGRTAFADVQDAVDGLERAKTAVRALGRYVPIDLVRELYQLNREPQLGGELRELSILFTDLEGFTSLSEKMAPDALAKLLGSYLQVMTDAIRAESGTVDKFVGDAVMALWNAPSLRADHAQRACAAVLRCQAATKALYASAAWNGQPPLRTRFGLHRARVMVGHFGAPERLSYTAMGDGVNLAARLESLCKQYGVTALVSEAIEEAARGHFAFRLVDKVAVKGRAQAVRVYELLDAPSAIATRYEEAFAAYSNRDFNGAIAILDTQPDDGPGKVLVERCRKLLLSPPPADWNGVHVAASK